MLHTGTERKEPDFQKLEVGLAAVGAGWSQLVRKVYDTVDTFRATGHPVKITTVKEKFGALRVYVDVPHTAPGKDDLSEALWSIERESTTVCEICGKPGQSMADHYRVQTVCDEHKRPHAVKWEYGNPLTGR